MKIIYGFITMFFVLVALLVIVTGYGFGFVASDSVTRDFNGVGY